MAGEYWTERIECLFAQHPGSASVVINNCGERSRSFRLVQDSVKSNCATRKRNGICRG